MSTDSAVPSQLHNLSSCKKRLLQYVFVTPLPPFLLGVPLFLCFKDGDFHRVPRALLLCLSMQLFLRFEGRDFCRVPWDKDALLWLELGSTDASDVHGCRLYASLAFFTCMRTFSFFLSTSFLNTLSFSSPLKHWRQTNDFGWMIVTTACGYSSSTSPLRSRICICLLDRLCSFRLFSDPARILEHKMQTGGSGVAIHLTNQ